MAFRLRHAAAAAAILAPLAARPDTAPADWSLHAQSTWVEQWHDGFASPYQGENSLDPNTEDAHTLSATIFIGRAQDPAGLAGVVDGLSRAHRDYLAAGGYGFAIGDGRLNYGTEDIIETYYNWKPFSWIALAFDYQFVDHPAYNRDRGPVSIYAVRAHWEK